MRNTEGSDASVALTDKHPHLRSSLMKPVTFTFQAYIKNKLTYVKNRQEKLHLNTIA